MAGQLLEIICSQCGADTFVRREPRYEGFSKVGENCVCVACGHVYENENDVPFKKKQQVSVFDADDVPVKIEIFKDNERHRNCRYCKHYLVNPFTQRCGLHDKPVAATDYCDEFELKQTE
ncbi:MAG: hypothetical protein JXN60_09040 [Lentisphaerae bacterium]|nr:hypothetical protein [Lentisphaerota bacterium]